MSKNESISEEGSTTPPKKKSLIAKAVLPLALLTAGGGGVFGLMSAGLIGGAHEQKEDHSPQLILKGEEDPSEVTDGKPEEGAAEFVYGEAGSKYRTAYFSFSDDFTSNLADSEGLIQLTLAASTQRDGRVLMWLKKHELAIRSQLLSDLADTPEFEVVSAEGKERLRKRMTASINRVLEENEGFGGVDQVYFRSLIIQ